LFLLLALVSPAPAAGAPAPATRPNVIFIVADDLGYADVGAQGIDPDVKTPNIDALAKAGARFTSAYVSSPVCSPSRAGLLTGRYQERFGHELNPIDEEKFGLPLDQVTLADVFKRAGYATGAIGKWHLGHRPEYRPMRRGFDEFFGFLGGAHRYANPSGTDGPEYNTLRRGDEPVPDEKGYLTDVLTREAVSSIDRHRQQPFFLYVPYNAVHSPMQAPPKYRKGLEGITDKKRQTSLAMLAALDQGVGRIMSGVEEAGLAANTLIVFLSDNGGPTPENASSNAPLRGFKGTVWEGGIRIPMIIRWPGRVRANQVLEQPVISLDLFPTALSAAGAQPPDNVKLDGVDLLPWLEGKRSDAPHDALYWRFTPQWAVREGNFKLLRSLASEEPQLFDLSADLAEKRDLASEKPDVVKRLREKYDAWSAQLMPPRWEGRQEGAHYETGARK
jgi:arylsulfatase A-like enzyme